MKRFFLWIAMFGVLLSGCAAQKGPCGLDAKRIQADTEYLCNEIGDRPTGTDQERLACDWLEDQLEAMGFSKKAGTLERTAFSGLFELTSENLVAVCNPGADGPILCAMAHYDTVEGTPGARDNTASVAVLLELARYLGPEREEFHGEIRLLFLGSEENGYHGASAYVNALTPEEKSRHLAVFNLENSAASPGPGAVLTCFTKGGTVDGAYQEGNFMEPMSNLVSDSLSQAYETIYDGGPIPVFHGGLSDHVIFHEAGIDAANISWRFLNEEGHPTVPPEYHLPTDVPETMDFNGGAITGECILNAMRQLAG